ncbi:MAG: Flp family type IVb pilin [Beijerinckiaceae bacterium]|nr:MAG: Flp family type IVb pilin [Beijerinckiaceae bacterium]
MDFIKRFLQDKTAATAIEYSMIAAFIAILIIVSLKGIGTSLSNRFNAVANNLT